MKRDMELVRQILLAFEAVPADEAPEVNSIDGYSDTDVAYHLYILVEAGLLRGDVVTDQEYPPVVQVFGLSWGGHEFIASARPPEVWEKGKKMIAKLGDVSFAVWSQVLTSITMKNLGL